MEFVILSWKKIIIFTFDLFSNLNVIPILAFNCSWACYEHFELVKSSGYVVLENLFDQFHRFTNS